MRNLMWAWISVRSLKRHNIARALILCASVAGSSGLCMMFAGDAWADAPTNTEVSILGTPAVGQTLTASNTWTSGDGTPVVDYQWMRCDSGGANCLNTGTDSPTYPLGPADAGHTIVVQETATDLTNDLAIMNSAPTTVTPFNTSVPAISGIPLQSQTLTETNGAWTSDV